MKGLMQDAEGNPRDWVFEDTERFVWITVDNISVGIINRDGIVCVELYPKGMEARDPLETAALATAVAAIHLHNREY